MDITNDINKLIGQPEGISLEYKLVLPPASTLAQLISSFANADGGLIVLGAGDRDGSIQFNGLSDEFRAESITRKAIDLLSPVPAVQYKYVEYGGKRLFVIGIDPSTDVVTLGGREYIRIGANSVLKQDHVKKTIRNIKIDALSTTIEHYRIKGTSAKNQLLDHYQSILNLVDTLGDLLYPTGASLPATSAEGRVLTRILFSSCADNFETYLSDLLLEIYLAKPEALKSESTVTVREVLECSDMQEFISAYAKKKLAKLQRGSVKGFIGENKQISALGVFDTTIVDGVEKILQIRHLFAHRNGIVDAKFQGYFPATTVNTDYLISLNEFLDMFEYLAGTVHAVDQAAVMHYGLVPFS